MFNAFWPSTSHNGFNFFVVFNFHHPCEMFTCYSSFWHHCEMGVVHVLFLFIIKAQCCLCLSLEWCASCCSNFQPSTNDFSTLLFVFIIGTKYCSYLSLELWDSCCSCLLQICPWHCSIYKFCLFLFFLILFTIVVINLMSLCYHHCHHLVLVSDSSL
jgi:hypothetical protein